MGYRPPPPPPRLNLDRNGMPLDYATYVWLLYRKSVDDRSPARRAFMHGTPDHPKDFGSQDIMGGSSLYAIAVRMQSVIFEGIYLPEDKR